MLSIIYLLQRSLKVNLSEDSFTETHLLSLFSASIRCSALSKPVEGASQRHLCGHADEIARWSYVAHIEKVPYSTSASTLSQSGQSFLSKRHVMSVEACIHVNHRVPCECSSCSANPIRSLIDERLARLTGTTISAEDGCSDRGLPLCASQREKRLAARARGPLPENASIGGPLDSPHGTAN